MKYVKIIIMRDVIELIIFITSLIVGFFIWNKIKIPFLGSWWKWTGNEDMVGHKSKEEVFYFVWNTKSKSEKQIWYGGCVPTLIGLIIFFTFFGILYS